MIYLGAVLAYLGLYCFIAWLSDKHSPLVGVGGLVVVLTLVRWMV